MLLLQNGVYVSLVNGDVVILLYKGKNAAELYVNGAYEGMCPFDDAKRQISKIEDDPLTFQRIRKADQILLKELREPEKDDDPFLPRK